MDAGTKGPRKVKIQALDYMDALSTFKPEQLTVQANKRPDEVLATVVAALPVAPLATDYDADPDTYERALHTGRDESSTGRAIAQKMAQSSMGRVWVKGDLTGGETLAWWDRGSRVKNTTLSLTLSDQIVTLKTDRSTRNIYNMIDTTTYPVQVNAGATLYTAQREIVVAPGATVTFKARFTDSQSTGRRLSGSENHVTPVEDTHYRASATEGGSGNDLSSDCTVVMDWGSNTAEVAITNGAAVNMFVNLFFLVGDALLTYDPSIYTKVNAASKLNHGPQPLRYDMPYQDDPNVGRDFGDYLENRWSDPGTEITGAGFWANRNATLMAAAMTLDLGKRIKIIESVTAMSTEFYVVGLEHIYNAGHLRINLSLELASQDTFCILDKVGWAELNSTAYLGV
jgi:hypothetical protein